MSASKKPRVDIPADACIICLGKFTKSQPAVTPDLKKLDKLFEAASAREDDVSLRLSPNEQNIKSGTLKIKYHRDCRSTYQSPLHIKHMQMARQQSAEPEKMSNHLLLLVQRPQVLIGNRNVLFVEKLVMPRGEMNGQWWKCPPVTNNRSQYI